MLRLCRAAREPDRRRSVRSWRRRKPAKEGLDQRKKGTKKKGAKDREERARRTVLYSSKGEKLYAVRARRPDSRTSSSTAALRTMDIKRDLRQTATGPAG